MGSTLGRTLANTFFMFHEQIWLTEYPDKFKSVYHQSYIEDIFAFFRLPNHLEEFKKFLISKPRNIRFTCGKKRNNFIPF